MKSRVESSSSSGSCHSSQNGAESSALPNSLIFEAAEEGVLILDANTRRITDANQFICKLLSFSRAELMGKELCQVGLLTDTAQNTTAFRELEVTGRIRYETLPLMTKKGELKEVEFFSEIYPFNGKRAILCIIRDVGERRQALKQIEKRYEDGIKLTEINRRLVGIFDFDQMTEVICRAARELTGADGATFVLREGERVRYVAEYSSAPLWKGLDFPIKNCISGWSILNAEPAVIEDIYADGRIPHEAYQPTFVKALVMMPVGSGLPVASIGVYWDRRYRASPYEIGLLQSLASGADLALASVRAYEETRQARIQAEQANRLKDEFLATLSHELRNPLNNITGYSEIMLRNAIVKENPLLKQSVQVIQRNVIAQTQLINDLLDLSRLQTGKLGVDRKPLTLAPVVNDAVEAASVYAAEREMTLEVILHSEPLTVNADPVRMQQIVWNLVNNAVKFTPKGGWVKVTLAAEGKEAKITVEDNGHGIDPEFLPYVFEMFRQADARTTRAFGGLGIGLALVRQLVELHGGRVSVESPGRGLGATFTVYLPVHQVIPQKHQVVSNASVSRSRKLKGMKVLIVDDTQDTLDMLSLLLQDQGAIVQAAASGKDALKLAEDHKFDLVLSDISMPGMDGYEFLQNLRSNSYYKDIPAIAVSGLGREEDIKRAQQVGFSRHITKPVDFDHLLKHALDSINK